MKHTKTLVMIILFMFGAVAGVIVSNLAYAAKNSQMQDSMQLAAGLDPFSDDLVRAQGHPRDRVPESAIAVYKDRVVVDMKNIQWATFTDTHSMEPLIFTGSNALEIVPKSDDEIQVGDIVSYKSKYAEGSIIHRVVYKGVDEQGTYYIMKGDNLPTNDPGRIRFEQIQRVVIGIIY